MGDSRVRGLVKELNEAEATYLGGQGRCLHPFGEILLPFGMLSGR